MRKLLKIAELLCKLKIYRNSSQSTKAKEIKKKKYIYKNGDQKRFSGERVPLPDVKGEVLCGIHPVQAALHSGKRQAYAAFFTAGLHNERLDLLREQCLERRVPVIDMKGFAMDSLSGHHPHQGVCMDVSKYKPDQLCVETEITSDKLYSRDGKPQIWVLPFHVIDTMNMGGIIRSSYFFGVDKVVLPARYSSALNFVVCKASAGALEVMDILAFKHESALETCLMKWREVGGLVVGSTGDEYHDKAIYTHEYVADKPTLLILGNEAEGINERVMNLCDILLCIKNYRPEHQHLDNFCVDSLNVSVATGILLQNIMTSRNRH